MSNATKKYYQTMVVFVSLTIFIITACTKDNNPIEIKDNKDPHPEINKLWLNWIKTNSNEIKSLDSDDFSDLKFLPNYLQNKKIIQLGESTHGAKEFNKMKVRLIKYLHQELNFNVLAFESSVFACFYAYANKLDEGPTKLMRNSIFGVWYTEEVKELFSYIIETQKTKNPLILVGFDIQPSGLASYQRPEFLKTVFEKISIEKADSLKD